jgi:hypothetical protein
MVRLIFQPIEVLALSGQLRCYSGNLAAEYRAAGWPHGIYLEHEHDMPGPEIAGDVRT